MHDAVSRGGRVHLSLCAICSPSIVVVCPPLLAHLKWQFVKHGPLLAFSVSTQPFPARLLLSLTCPPSLLFASLGLPSSFNLSLISISPAYSASALSPPVYLSLLFRLILWLSFALLVYVVFLFHYQYLFISHPIVATAPISPPSNSVQLGLRSFLFFGHGSH